MFGLNGTLSPALLKISPYKIKMVKRDYALKRDYLAVVFRLRNADINEY
jgi:hypothetical protein